MPNRPIYKLDDDEALALLKSRQATGENGRDPTHVQLERLWFQAIAYYAGLHNARYGEGWFDDFDFEQQLVVPQYAANHIGRMVRQEVSRMSRARPSMEVTPDTPDQKDIFGANAAEHIADWLYYDANMADVRDELGFWLCCCGTAFDYHGWDPSAGSETRVYKDLMTQDPVAAEELQEGERNFYDQMGSYEQVSEGDFDNEVISSFQVRVPVGPVKLDRMPWMTITRLMSLDEIWDRWPNKAKDIQVLEHTSTSIDGYYWRRLATLITSIGHTFPTRGSSWLEGIEVHYHIIPVSKRWPNGLYVVATNDVVLENGPHPYMTMGVDMRWPVTDYHYMPQPGRYWSKSLVEELMHGQEDYNLNRQQIISQRDVLSKPQWMAPRQVELSSSENTLGVMWEYNAHGGGKPELVQPPTLGQHQVVGAEMTLNDMQTIAAQSDVTQAQVPSGVRSGVAIRALQEKDETVVAGTDGRMERQFQKSMRSRLMLFAKFVKSKRKIAVYGESRMAELKFFSGEDLNNNTALRIVPGSMLPRSRAAQQLLFLDAMQAGFLNPADPEVQRYGLEIMEMANLQQVLFEYDGQRRRANIENTQFHYGSIETGFPDVDQDDDHQQHIQRHMSFKLTDSYEQLPMARKMAFDAHIQKHYAMMAQIMTAPMMLQQQMGPAQAQGSPPKELGEASQPRPADRQSSPEGVPQ